MLTNHVILRIRDSADGKTLSFDLRDVLETIAADGAGLAWTILDLEARAQAGTNLLAIEREIDASESGKTMSWDEIYRLAASLTQTVNALIAGHLPGVRLTKSMEDEQLLEMTDVLIEALDGGDWTVGIPEGPLADALRGRFRDIECRDRWAE